LFDFTLIFYTYVNVIYIPRRYWC